jgi:hypothetical protein
MKTKIDTFLYAVQETYPNGRKSFTNPYPITKTEATRLAKSLRKIARAAKSTLKFRAVRCYIHVHVKEKAK